MSKKPPLTSSPSSKDWYISWVIDINWFIHESPGLKPDWFWEIKSFSIQYSKSLLYIKRSKIFPQMGSKETGRETTLNFCSRSKDKLENHYKTSFWKSHHFFLKSERTHMLVPHSPYLFLFALFVIFWH